MTEAVRAATLRVKWRGGGAKKWVRPMQIASERAGWRTDFWRERRQAW